jgi:hypothetical protein
MRAPKLEHAANGHVNHDLHNESASYFPTLLTWYTPIIYYISENLHCDLNSDAVP